MIPQNARKGNGKKGRMKKGVQSQECELPSKWLLTAPYGFKLCGSESAELTRRQMVGLAAAFSAAHMPVSVLTFDETDERITERFYAYPGEKNPMNIFIRKCALKEFNKIDVLIRGITKMTNFHVFIINHISDGVLSNDLVKRLEHLAKSCKLRIYFFAQLTLLRKYLEAKAAKEG